MDISVVKPLSRVQLVRAKRGKPLSPFLFLRVSRSALTNWTTGIGYTMKDITGYLATRESRRQETPLLFI